MGGMHMPRIYRPFITGVILLFAICILLVGCSESSGSGSGSGEQGSAQASADEGQPQKGGEVAVAYNTDVSNYDPILGGSGGDHALLWPVFDTLISFNADLEPEPGLAESWEFPDDNTIQLNLREDVTFHDGTVFDAEAVRFNIERINSDESKITDLENIEEVEVVDSQTINLHLKQPDSSILLALADRGGMMVSPTAVKEKGESFSEQPIGAGAYKMASREPNGEIVLEAFEDYWKDNQPYLDKITIKVMGEENTRINALKSGEVDLAYDISPGNVQNLKNDANIVLKERTSVAFRKIYINTSLAPFDIKEVRQAVLHGIDRESIIQAINFGSGEIANQPFPEEYWAAGDMKIDYDPDKARNLLKEAGAETVSFSLIHHSNAYETRIAEAIQAQLKEIGIQVDLQAMELTAATAGYFSEKKAPALLSQWTGRPDPQMTMANLFSGESFFNTGSHSTPEIEEFLLEAASTNDQTERAEIYSQMSEQGLLEEAVHIPLFFITGVSAMTESVKGYEPTLLGKPVFTDIWKSE